MGLHGPPKGKAKKSDGFWHCAGSPKILAHLTSQRDDGGEGGKEHRRKKKKKEKVALTKLGENEGNKQGLTNY